MHLLTPPNCWADSLWHDICPHAHLETLWAQLLSTTRITIVSNAAVHPNGSGTCAWIIWANSELRSGKGYTPGPPTNMYSGLAEAYGLYTALSFIQQYCTYYPIIQNQQCRIHAYCDNRGVIDQTTHTSPSTYPGDAISNNYPIYAEIWQTIKNLKPLTIHIHHVLGHQDKQKDCPLTLPKKLNIDCNASTSAMQPNPDLAQNKQNPANSAGYPHLCIRKQNIIRHLQHVLRDASQCSPYYDYLQNKFSWTTTPEMTVHWPTIQMALTRFTQSEQQILTKFAHEWLPLQDHYHVTSLSTDQVCPSCQGRKKWHNISLHALTTIDNKYGKSYMIQFRNIQSTTTSAPLCTISWCSDFTKANKPWPQSKLILHIHMHSNSTRNRHNLDGANFTTGNIQCIGTHYAIRCTLQSTAHITTQKSSL